MMAWLNQSSLVFVIPAGFVIFFVSLTVARLVDRGVQKRAVVRKIQQSAAVWGQPRAVAERIETGRPGPLAAWMQRFLASIGSKAMGSKPQDYTGRRLKFLKAGIRNESAPAVFFGAKIFLALAFALGFHAARIMFFPLLANMPAMLLSVAAALIGLYLPDVYVDSRTSVRKKKIAQGLPDALDLLEVCVEAGLGLDSAITKVSGEISMAHPSISEELKMMNLELRAGKPRQEALRDMAARTDVESFKSLITLLIQTDKFGTSIAKSLRVFSDSFRKKRFQVAEEMAAKLPVKLVFPLVVFIFPSLLVVILGPAMIRIYEMFAQRGVH